MGNKGDLSVFKHGMVVHTRWAGMSISETSDLLGFSHTQPSLGFNGLKKKISSECQFCEYKYLVDAKDQRRMTRPV